VCVTKDEWNQTLNLVKNQTKEIVKATSANESASTTIVTCPCGWRRSLTLLYKCLYCKVYFCHQCAEQHFGQTVEEYRKENPIEE
jgi:predicted nucleic acid binding AN1-type Zn finger protein